MKKVYGYLGMLLVLTILISTTLVVAQTNFDVLGEKFGAISVMENFDLGTKSSSVLLGVLLFMILQSIFSKMELFGGGKTISATIALVVTLLTFIYVPDHLFDALATNYAALGATILTVLPFIIAMHYTLMVTKDLTMARVIWGIFASYYVVIFIYNWGQGSTGFLDPSYFLYLVAFIASLVLFIFVGPIRKWVWDANVKAAEERIGANLEKFRVGITAGIKAGEAAADADRA